MENLYLPRPRQLASVGEADARHKQILQGLLRDHKTMRSWERAAPRETCEAAYRALLRKVQTQYGERPDRARYGDGKVSLPPDGLRGVHLSAHQPAAEKNLLENEEAGLMGAGLHELDTSWLYSGPVLYGDDDAWHAFLDRLLSCGVVELTPGKRTETVRLFFVVKPNGKLRLIVDCRAVNEAGSRPPKTRMGSVAAMADLAVPEGEELFTASSDLSDFFYTFLLPVWLRDWFRLRPAQLSKLTHPSAKALLESGEARGTPRLTCPPMGWPWAPHFCDQAHRTFFVEDDELGKVAQVEEGTPALVLTREGTYSCLYVDDAGLGGVCSRNVERLEARYLERIGEAGWLSNDEKRAPAGSQSWDIRLGVVIDGKRWVLHQKSEKMVRLRRALEYARRRRFMGLLEAQTIVGHCIAASLASPHLLSIFDQVFKLFEQPARGRRPLGTLARNEFEIFRRVLPHSWVDLRGDFYPEVFSTDSTLCGWGVTAALVPAEEIAKAWAVKEKWRHDPRFQAPPARREIEAAGAVAKRLERLGEALGTRPAAPSLVKADHQGRQSDVQICTSKGPTFAGRGVISRFGSPPGPANPLGGPGDFKTEWDDLALKLRKCEFQRWRKTSGGLRRETYLAPPGHRPAADGTPKPEEEAARPARGHRPRVRILIGPANPAVDDVMSMFQVISWSQGRRPFWEIFAREAQLTKFVSHLNETVVAPLERLHSPLLDITIPTTREAVYRFLGTGRVGWLWLAPPQASWAQHPEKEEGRCALRSESEPLGIGDLSRKEDAVVKLGNLVADFCFDAMGIAMRAEKKAEVGLCVPWRSLMRCRPRFAATEETLGCSWALFSKCMTGCPARRDTGVFTSSRSVKKGALPCDGHHHHRAVRGKVRFGKMYVKADDYCKAFDDGFYFELARLVCRDLRSARGSDHELTAPAERPSFPPVSTKILEEAEGRVRWAAAWRYPEPIHRLEGRASLALLRWLARKADTRGRRVLILNDNLSFAHSANKGRAGDRGLLRLCREAGAIQLASRIRVRWRYVESHRNPADEPSRWFEKKGLESNDGCGH